MQLTESSKTNFNTLQKACNDKRLALLDCQDAETGESVPVIVAVDFDGQEYSFVPLAKMFVRDPYEELNPPNPEGGYFPGA
jgi:uncharacterized protein DUF6117